MVLILDALLEILRKPTAGDIMAELALFAAPVWIAVLVGLLLGWAWRPKWAAVLVIGDKAPELLPSLPSLDLSKGQLGTSSLSAETSSKEEENPVNTCSPVLDNKELPVTDDDFEHLRRLVEEKDAGPAWIHMMDRSLPSMSYQAWRRDPESGPPQYRSSTIYDDATPELVRDFFWDDEFRIKNRWDDMLLSHETLEEFPATGSMVVRWIRKFPFFCSDREYIIGRRIWQLGRSYYCITKGVPYPSIPKRNKPRRVDLYYSSWCIRPVESRKGDGQITACEVLLFHHEDMGIPWELAKLGVRQGMWACVKKIEPGLRAYETARKAGEPLSQVAAMAQINTKVNTEYLAPLETSNDRSDLVEAENQKSWGLPKFLLIGGVVALACTIDHGLLTKAVIFGVGRRFAKPGRRL